MVAENSVRQTKKNPEIQLFWIKPNNLVIADKHGADKDGHRGGVLVVQQQHFVRGVVQVLRLVVQHGQFLLENDKN